MKDKATNLRHQAEELLKNKSTTKKPDFSDIEIIKLVHELDVHQIELEMQNEELLLAKKKAETDAEKYTNLYDFAPSGYFTLSKEGEIVELNFRGATLLGKERSLLLNNSFSVHISEETRPTFNLFFEEIFESRTRQTCEIELSIATKIPTYVYLSGICNDEEGGQCLLTMVDITKRKKAEEATKISEEKYRTLFETNRDSITIFRIDTNDKPENFIEANPATTTLFGYTKKELLAMNVSDIETLSDKKRQKRIGKLQLQGRIDFETVIKNKKGNLRNVEIETILINYLNEPAVMNITRDITERKQTEDNIRKAQESLVTILEAIPDLLFEVDLEGRIYHYQAHRDDLLAIPAGEFMGKLFSEVYPKNASSIILKALEEANKKGWSAGKQYSLDFPKDGKHWFELSISTIKESSDKEKHFILLARDITERKIAEEELLVKKTKLETVLTGTNTATWEWNIKTGETIFDKHWAEIIGYTLEEISPVSIDTWVKFSHPDDLIISNELLEKCFKGKSKYYECEIRMKHKNGDWIWILDKGKVNEFDTDGKPLIMSGTHQDITKGKLAEIALKENEEKLLGIFNVANSGIIMVDTKGEFVLFNDWCCEMLGYTREEFSNLNSFKITHPEDYEHSKQFSDKLNEGKIDKYQIEKRYLRKDKSFFWGDVSVSVIKDENNKHKYAIGIIIDITERKKIEKALYDSERFAHATFDALSAQIAILDENGFIITVNLAWREFVKSNTPKGAKISKIEGTNYFSVCETAEGPFAEEASTMAKGIRSVMNGEEKEFSLEYPCHSPTEKRWFNARVTRFPKEGDLRIVVAHENITERMLAKEKLKESEARLVVAQAVAKVGSWETDFTFTKVIWSKETGRIFGIDPETVKITLEKFLEIVHPEDRLIVETTFVHSIKSQTLNKFEHRIITPDGIEKTVEERWEIIRDKEGKPLRSIGTCQDITERKVFEEQILLSKTRFSSIIDSSPIGMAINDEHQNITYLNRSFIKMFGYTLKDIKKVQDWTIKAYPEPAYSKKIMNAWFTELEKINQTGEEFTPMEVVIRCKNGLNKTVLVSANPIPSISKQEYLINFYDITERKQAEKNVEDSLNLIQNITSRVPGVVYQFLLRPDGSSCFPYASEGIKKIYSVTPDEVREDASKVFEKILPDDLEAVSDSIQKSAKKMIPWKHEYRVRIDDGIIRYLSGNAIPQKEKDGSVLWHGFISDVTERKMAEKALLDSEEKYRGLVENSPDAVVIYVDGKIVYVNEEGIRMVGARNKEEIIGRPVLQFIHPDSLGSVIQSMEEVILDNNVSKIVEEKFVDLDGSPFDVELKAIPTFFEHKEAVQVIIHDITKRKQSLLELNKMNRVYSLISQINNLILRSKDRDELLQEICRIAVTYGKFRMSWIGMLDDDGKTVNTAAFYGVEEGYFTEYKEITILDEPQGKGPTGTAMRERRTITCNNIATDPLMGPWHDRAKERGYRSSIAIPIVVLDKTVGSFNLYSEETDSFSSVEEVELLEKITQNIAFKLESIIFEEDRIKTQDKIKQLSQAVEQSPVTIVITNTKGEIEYVNPKFSETTGYSFDEVVGQNPRVLKSGHTKPEDYKLLWQTLSAGNEWHGEFHNIKKNGEFYWESASISPILNAQGKTTHYIAIKEDITSRKNVEKQLIKAKEKAEESDRLKSAFLANMSHEIRTPMNGILGFTELLKAPQLSGEEQQEYINIIEKSGKRMLNIINDIISISKVESGQIEISISETNVNEQIEYIHTFFRPEAKQKGIELSVSKLLSPKDTLIQTDREKVYAVLTNLVKNALKFTNEGSIEFGCEKKGGFLEFFIKDTGLGISKSQKKIIFERFRQANETISRTHEGSGLGLAISKAYVEMLGGKIWVESKEGKGSAFYFTIPFNSENKLEGTIVAEKVSSGLKEENKVKDLKVLIVEDDAISKLLITIAVKPYSKEIIKVGTGFEAIDACRSNPDIDLVMMDINMPEMGGYEATKLIREFNKDLVIIAQTANGMQSDRDDAIAAGCTDYISKPINITSLGKLIQKYFKK